MDDFERKNFGSKGKIIPIFKNNIFRNVQHFNP